MTETKKACRGDFSARVMSLDQSRTHLSTGNELLHGGAATLGDAMGPVGREFSPPLPGSSLPEALVPRVEDHNIPDMWPAQAVFFKILPLLVDPDMVFHF